MEAWEAEVVGKTNVGAELATFNAAYATIRTAISHERELSSCVKQIGQMVDARQELTEKANRRKNGFMAKLKGTNG